VNTGGRIKGTAFFFLISVVILFSLFMDILPLCPKELNAFITRKKLKI
jgi:alkyl hydroperoxide reductase subunit AhpC